MDRFPIDVLEAVAKEREVRLTTYGRNSGNASTVTIWITADGPRVFIRSGQGLKRHWPQNLLKRPEGTLLIGGRVVRFKSRHVTEPAEARLASRAYGPKYGASVVPSKPSDPPTPGEQATFELLPADL